MSEIPSPLLDQIIIPEPLDRGLVGEWRFDRNTGLLLPDFSGNSLSAQHQGTPDWRAGEYGVYQHFSGAADQWLYRATAGVLNLTGDLTVEALIRTTDTTDYARIFQRYLQSSPWPGYTMAVNPDITGGANKLGFWSDDSGSFSWTHGDSDVNDGAWHHVLVALTATKSHFYHDGLPDGSPDSGHPSSWVGGFCIAATYDGSGRLTGDIALLRVYARALLAWEVLKRYEIVTARGSGLYVSRYWDLFWGIGEAAGIYYKSLTGTLGFSGSLLKQVQKEVAGDLGLSGELVKETQKELGGSLSFAGSLSRLPQKLLGGVLSVTGTVSRETRKLLSGDLTLAGGLVKQVRKLLAGDMAFGGTLGKQVRKLLSGNLGFSGGLLKQVRKLLAGQIGFSGSLAKQVRKVLSGELTFAGLLATVKTYLKTLSGSLTLTGTLTKRTQKILTGQIAFSGAVIKQIRLRLAGVLSFAADLVALLIGGRYSCSSVDAAYYTASGADAAYYTASRADARFYTTNGVDSG